MRKERKHFTPEEKVAILRRHLVDKVPVSGRQQEIHAERDRKLETARQQRQGRRQQAA